MTAAAISLITMIALVVYWFLIGTAISLVGCGLAFLADTPARAMRASRVLSVGLGLLAGPAVYLSLAALTFIA